MLAEELTWRARRQLSGDSPPALSSRRLLCVGESKFALSRLMSFRWPPLLDETLDTFDSLRCFENEPQQQDLTQTGFTRAAGASSAEDSVAAGAVADFEAAPRRSAAPPTADESLDDEHDDDDDDGSVRAAALLTCFTC